MPDLSWLRMSLRTSLTMSRRDRRTLLVGVVAIGSILTVFRGIPAWLRRARERREAVHEVVREATESELAVRNAPLYERGLRVGEQRYFALAPVLLDGEPMAAAGAALTSAVGDAATASNLQVGALQVHTDSGTVGEIARISLRGEATGDVTGITHFLSALEGGAPLMTVRELTLTQADPAAPDDRPEALRVEFVVEAVARTDSGDRSGGRGPVSVAGLVPQPREVFVYDAAVLGRAADSVSVADPFRLARRPPRVAFGTTLPNAPPPRPRLQLALDGIVGGPPWRAVLEGVPMHDGSTVVAAGDTIGGLTVRSIRRDTVVVWGMDTTWTLTRGH